MKRIKTKAVMDKDGNIYLDERTIKKIIDSTTKIAVEEFIKMRAEGTAKLIAEGEDVDVRLERAQTTYITENMRILSLGIKKVLDEQCRKIKEQFTSGKEE